jgi:translation initiation factor 4E
MADVATAPNPNQQVPLDTIPISPTGGSGDGNGKSSSDANAAEGEVRTVFHDPENFNVKHPLMNTWTLWFTKPPSGKVRSKITRCARR